MIIQPPSHGCVKLSANFAHINAMLINMGHWHLFADTVHVKPHCTSSVLKQTLKLSS